MRRPFAIYIGRIDENKGCGELFDHFQRYARDVPARPRPGARSATPIMPVPAASIGSIISASLATEDKFDALAAADLLIMPSYFESLSMVALEAWALGRPVLANGRCDVLKGQCIRSNARACTTRATRSSSRRSTRSSRTARCTPGSDSNGREYFVAQLRLAGHRAQVPGHVRAAAEREPLRGAHRTAARLDGATPARSCLPPRRSSPASRSAPPTRRRAPEPHDGMTHDGPSAARPSGPRHARLRRRHRPRGARHPARAARRRIRLRDLRRDRRSAARAAHARLPRHGRRASVRRTS